MMTSNNENKNTLITKKDLMKVFWRSFTLEWSWNYERQGHMGYCYAISPILCKLYPDKEDRAQALQRHLEFFNTTPHIATLILGISAAMEETNAKEKGFDVDSINNIKVGLMGPLAGIGDSFVWGTLRIIATGIGTSLALQGNILGPILFFFIFNIPTQLLRYFGIMGGYRLGSGLLEKIQKSGLMENLTFGASVLGLMVIGAMTASMVAIEIPIKVGQGEAAMTIQSICDEIMPGILVLGFTGLIYYLLNKNVKVTTILLLMTALGIAGAYFGFLGVVG